ncbi:MAG: entericidin EcnA/B family protein [Paracoccaceae bacterium]
MRIALLALTLALAGCGTVAGVGEDISAGSRTVQSWF